MSEIEPRRSAGTKLSLRHLLAFTAFAAVGLAVGLAYRKNSELIQQRDQLLSLSSRLRIENYDELASSAMPPVAEDFETWKVHVPEGQEYELRLGVGAITETGIPSIAGKVRLAAGQHRVTLHATDSLNEASRFVVYVDGEQVIEKTMGSDWLPDGWSSASGSRWPRSSALSQSPLQLTARRYELRHDFGPRNYFNGQSDSSTTQPGYRLWIDKADRNYARQSPFIGFANDPQYLGIGLRDGVRFKTTPSQPFELVFTRPSLATVDPVLRIDAEFFASDGTVVSKQNQSVPSWERRAAASGSDPLSWKADLSRTTYTAFLHANSKADKGFQPVLEIKWDAGKPDEVGLRLAETPANEAISRWRLRILGGANHLWRELQIGEGPWATPADVISAGDSNNAFHPSDASDPIKVPDGNPVRTSFQAASIDLGDVVNEQIQIRWQTNEALPLQIVERKDRNYAGLELYRGLPVRLGMQIPTTLQPTLAVDLEDQHPDIAETDFPGGPIFEAIQVDLEPTDRDWIWLSIQSKE